MGGRGSFSGGQAAWAVNELNSRYGDGLQLVGTVALSPAVNMSGLADRALSRTLTPWQTSLMPYVIDGLSRYDSTVVGDHYLRGQAARTWRSSLGAVLTQRRRGCTQRLTMCDQRPLQMRQRSETRFDASRYLKRPLRFRCW